ncbi:facilitated trehalose transporter Tret1-like [Colias croceus]|uniref:facilitated trehalose transporter Tret1-like n=1 Tax=Colias crocea TaxID=72248 RepID=UPI001E27BED0|nr:facilitated trehalose transporter Tret1-like [Colias croceus]
MRLAFPNLIVLAIARSLAGITASGTFIVITIYLREISQNDIIATLGSLPTLLQNSGFLLMFIIGATCDYYRMLWIFLLLPCICAVLFLAIPESPDYLVKHDKLDHALETIAFLRGLTKDHPIVKADVEFMKRIEDEHKLLPKISFKVILRDKAWRRGFLICLVVFTIHAWNGAFTILVFAESILKEGHFNIIRAEYQTISFPSCMIVASLCFICIAEKWGRRNLLATSFTVTMIAFIILGIGLKIHLCGYCIPNFLPFLLMIVVVVMYSGGIRPLPSIIATEMFSFQIRAKVIGLLIAYSWVVVSTQLLAYGHLVDTIGLPFTFILFGFMNFIGLVSSLLLPETKGRNVEEIKKLLLQGKSS